MKILPISSVASKPVPPRIPPKPVAAQPVNSAPVPPKMPPKMPPKPKVAEPVEEVKEEQVEQEQPFAESQVELQQEVQQDEPVVQETEVETQENIQDELVEEKVEESKPKKEKVQKIKEPKPEKPKKIKEPKPEKVKEQKPEKPKKQLSTKVKLIIFASVFAVVAIAGVIIFFALQPKPEKLATPVISIHKLSNQTVLYVDQNKNAEYYEFYIQKIGDTDVKYIKSDTNEVNLRSFFQTKEELGEYEVWARYGSKNEKIASDESEREYCKYTKTLETPKVEYKSDDNSKIVWLPVANATAYHVYYGAKTSEYFRVTTSSSTSLVEFNLYEFDTKDHKFDITIYQELN